MLRDAHGNLVQQIEFYYGLAGNYFGGRRRTRRTAHRTAPLRTIAATIVVDDNQGQTLRTRDATGADRFASYNIRGDVAKEWQVVVNPMTSRTTDG